MKVLEDNSALIMASIHAGAVRAVGETAHSMKERAVAKLHEPKSGRVYYSKNRPSPHQASAPGEAPANWTGALAGAIYEVQVDLEAEVGVEDQQAPHGKILEHGTASGKIAARPFMLPSAIEEEPLFVERMTAEIEKALK